uniref:Uncharacterized protein n=1 Tax=Cuerna arida TaxID=1464854 RepID=A0A1B6ETK3_9HEMI
MSEKRQEEGSHKSPQFAEKNYLQRSTGRHQTDVDDAAFKSVTENKQSTQERNRGDHTECCCVCFGYGAFREEQERDKLSALLSPPEQGDDPTRDKRGSDNN